MKFSDERDLLAWFKPIDKVGSNISFFFFNKSVSVKAKGAQEYTGQIKRAQNKKQEKGYTKKKYSLPHPRPNQSMKSTNCRYPPPIYTLTHRKIVKENNC